MLLFEQFTQLELACWPKRNASRCHAERLGRFRWVVERTLSWLNRFRRLKVRYERRADIHQAFLSLGCTLICRRTLID